MNQKLIKLRNKELELMQKLAEIRNQIKALEYDEKKKEAVRHTILDDTER